MSKIDKIACLAFDPSAQEGEAIAAFLKLRALKAGSNVVDGHVQEPQETSQEQRSRPSSRTVGYSMPHNIIGEFIHTVNMYSRVKIGKSVKVRVSPSENGKWNVEFICTPFAYEEVSVTCQAVFNVWKKGKNTEQSYSTSSTKWDKWNDYYNSSKPYKSEKKGFWSKIFD